jgi:hypothetical protein
MARFTDSIADAIYALLPFIATGIGATIAALFCG